MALSSAILEWRNQGLPWHGRCEDELPRVRIVVAMPGPFTELCRDRPSSAGGTMYACSTYQYERRWPWSIFARSRVPLLVISALEPQPHRRRLVIHEAMHWLGSCSGKGIDYDHEDTLVWRGVMSAAQARLLDMLHPERERYRAARR